MRFSAHWLAWRGSLLLFAVILSAGCNSEPKGRSAQARPPAPVELAPVRIQEMPVELATIGTVEPIERVEIRSQVGGILKKVGFGEGDSVRKGQVLFEIERAPFLVALQRAEANLVRDRVQRDNARVQAGRLDELLKKGIVAQSAVDEARTTASALAAAVAADEAAVEEARLQLSYTTIRSPLHGKTGGLQVFAGNLVKAGDVTPLVTIVPLAPIRVAFAVPAQHLPDVRAALDSRREVEVRARVAKRPGPEARGTLFFVDNQVSSATGTILLKARFENADGALWPGDHVDVVCVLDHEPRALVVPSRAVIESQTGQMVWVVRGNRAQKRDIEVSRSMGDLAVVVRGLAAGERVVVDGQLRLFPGARVVEQRTAASAAPGHARGAARP